MRSGHHLALCPLLLVRRRRQFWDEGEIFRGPVHASDPQKVSQEFMEHLNAWCELHGEDLSGRCPHIRVGLPTSPEGKGADFTCSMWTPSSPYSTSSWMISASLTPSNSDAPDRQPPSPRAKSSPSPSSPGGRGSPARGTSTATLKPISEQHSLLSRTVPSSTVSCDSMPRTSRRSP